MKITVEKVIEENNKLKISVSHEFGLDYIELDKVFRKYDILAGVPKWQIEVKKRIEQKYADREKSDDQNAQFVGTEL